MEPGRELDALVAENVFGAKVNFERRYPRADLKLYHPCCPAMEDRCSPEDYFDVPEYSTDIAAAWEVFEKLLGKEAHAAICRRHDGRWLVVDDCGDGFDLIADGETAPHAICLAALKAVSQT